MPPNQLTIDGPVTAKGVTSESVEVRRGMAYRFLLLARSDQPTYLPVQVDIDSGAFVVSPETGTGAKNKQTSIELAELDADGNQRFSVSLGKDRINSSASTFRVMASDGATYIPVAVLRIVSTGDGSPQECAVVLGGDYGCGLYRDASGNVCVAQGSARAATLGTDAFGAYGAEPVAQQVLPTGAGKTVDDVIAALQATGLVRQS